MESPEVIFKVALTLLDLHKDELMKKDNFEEIMDYLKNVLSKIDGNFLKTLQKEVIVCFVLSAQKFYLSYLYLLYRCFP